MDGNLEDVSKSIKKVRENVSRLKKVARNDMSLYPQESKLKDKSYERATLVSILLHSEWYVDTFLNSTTSAIAEVINKFTTKSGMTLDKSMRVYPKSPGEPKRTKRSDLFYKMITKTIEPSYAKQETGL